MKPHLKEKLATLSELPKTEVRPTYQEYIDHIVLRWKENPEDGDVITFLANPLKGPNSSVRQACVIEDITFVGSGNNANVVLGVDLKLHDLVAIKIGKKLLLWEKDDEGNLTKQPETPAAKEAAWMKKFQAGDHPRLFVELIQHTVTQEEVGEKVFAVDNLIMEYLNENKWKDLKERGAEHNEKWVPFFTLEKIARFAVEINTAQEDMRKNGGFNPDLKPGNIKIDEGGHVKLLDFGLVETLPNAQAFSDGFNGAGCYVAPERKLNRISLAGMGLTEHDPIAMNMYTCAVLTYEAITGEPLFNYPEKTDLAIILRETRDYLFPAPTAVGQYTTGEHFLIAQKLSHLGVSPEQIFAVLQLFSRALAPDPNNRFVTMNRNPFDFSIELSKALFQKNPEQSITTESSSLQTQVAVQTGLEPNAEPPAEQADTSYSDETIRIQAKETVTPGEKKAEPKKKGLLGRLHIDKDSISKLTARITKL